jgi:hypothetical protein
VVTRGGRERSGDRAAAGADARHESGPLRSCDQT